MIIRRALLAVICVVSLLGSFGGWVAADGPGRVPRKLRRAHKHKPRAAANNAAAITPRVSLIDEAGFRKLLASGTSARSRPLLVNFWATWCDPCREEFPDLVKIDAEYRSKGLDFIAISLDDVADLKTKVPKFLRSQRATMPAYLLDVPDPETIIEIVDATWQGDLPATFLYDQSGSVAYKHKGPIKPAELRAAIDKLLDVKQ